MITLAAVAGAWLFTGAVVVAGVFWRSARIDQARADAALDFEAHVDDAIAVSNEQAKSAVRWTAEERARLRRAIETDIASVHPNHH